MTFSNSFILSYKSNLKVFHDIDSLELFIKENNIKDYSIYMDMTEYNSLKDKYDKSLELLSSFGLPCEREDFMNTEIDFCFSNCSVDMEAFKKCWDRYLEKDLIKEDS